MRRTSAFWPMPGDLPRAGGSSRSRTRCSSWPAAATWTSSAAAPVLASSRSGPRRRDVGGPLPPSRSLLDRLHHRDARAGRAEAQACGVPVHRLGSWSGLRERRGRRDRMRSAGRFSRTVGRSVRATPRGRRRRTAMAAAARNWPKHGRSRPRTGTTGRLAPGIARPRVRSPGVAKPPPRLRDHLEVGWVARAELGPSEVPGRPGS